MAKQLEREADEFSIGQVAVASRNGLDRKFPKVGLAVQKKRNFGLVFQSIVSLVGEQKNGCP